MAAEPSLSYCLGIFSVVCRRAVPGKLQNETLTRKHTRDYRCLWAPYLIEVDAVGS